MVSKLRSTNNQKNSNETENIKIEDKNETPLSPTSSSYSSSSSSSFAQSYIEYNALSNPRKRSSSHAPSICQSNQLANKKRDTSKQNQENEFESIDTDSNEMKEFPSVKQWILALFDEENKYKLARVIGWKLRGTNVTHLTHLVGKKSGNNSSSINSNNDNNGSLMKVNISESDSKRIIDYEFYVHFRGLNRRLDRWVLGENIKLSFHIDELDDPAVYEKLKNQGIDYVSSFIGGTSISGNKAGGSRHKKKNNWNIDISDGEDPEEHEGMDHSALLDHEETTRLKTIGRVRIGKFLLDTWYFSPFPDEYQNVDILHFCEFCLTFFCFEDELIRHLSGCVLRHPPGNEIYRKDNISIFEIDGALAKGYAENLCYLAKLFLDHKTLQYDVEPFLFYIVTEVDDEGCHIVGYFSKEKVSMLHYNLACILTLPCYQRKGYGKLLVDLSYKLSLREGKWGHPERPLSDLGRAIYNNWWANKISDYFIENYSQNNKNENDSDNENNTEGSSEYTVDERNFVKFIDDVVRNTGIRREDVIKVIEDNGILRNIKDQYYAFCDHEFLKEIIENSGRPGHPLYDNYFNWVPFSRDPPSEIEALPSK
ncbi:histone acetyltransferase (MYST family) [Cryptosporidium ryanae]|uniref:histone acetyltransferase (MYST family) n=1 Tax=Cryptosporidium ryanae TaxID=515981 RepID=UPI00351A078D|nr:histone acetyltransferase (MYST family) [Cryptosporidium ryanae]